jgi:hypothetical protein
MWKLKAHAENHARLFKDFASSFPRPIAVDLIQEFLALKWLDLTNETIQWQKVLAYFRELSERTYENTTITKNLILTPNERGTSDITESKHAKIFDILASSPQCFIKTDGQMRFVGYDEIRWKSVRDSEQSKFHPEFLQPFYCALADGEFSIHHTSKRDLIVVGRGGIIATKRKSRWKLYDPNNLKNSLGDILHGEYRIGCNIYEILFDLSFQRHGALLIFDPSDKLNAQVVNPHAWIVPEDADMGSAHSILRRRIRDIKSPVWGTTPKRDKRLFLELASVDGALIFSQSEIKAFGAMIKTHSKAKGQYGARATASLSAYLYGAYPIRISADGDVRLLFRSEDGQGNKHRAELAFA